MQRPRPGVSGPDQRGEGTGHPVQRHPPSEFCDGPRRGRARAVRRHDGSQLAPHPSWARVPRDALPHVRQHVEAAKLLQLAAL